jgi:hypothetical protein
MVTYRSTVSAYVQIIVRDVDGSKRVATLEQDTNNRRKWTGSVDHPSGQKYSVDTYSADEVDALGKLAQAFVMKEGDYAASKGRGHRFPNRYDRDANVRIDDAGNPIGAPITERR